MRPGSAKFSIAAILTAVAASSSMSHAETGRSAAIRQVTEAGTIAERSSAAFDQISTVETGRSRLDQIDPSLARANAEGGERLAAGAPDELAAGCSLTPEQQAIVTSLEAQGRLPAGVCEMAAWFAQPGDKVEGEDRRALAEAVLAGAPGMLGRDAEADRLAALELEQRQAEAAAAEAIALTILTPAVPVAPGN